MKKRMKPSKARMKQQEPSELVLGWRVVYVQYVVEKVNKCNKEMGAVQAKPQGVVTKQRVRIPSWARHNTPPRPPPPPTRRPSPQPVRRPPSPPPLPPPPPPPARHVCVSTAIVPAAKRGPPPSYNAIIYILCHTQARLEEAQRIYAPYGWAVPIMMKYQNATFENAFWQQMWQIRGSWRKASVVGAFSFRAYQKLNLNVVEHVLMHKSYEPNGYFHFMDSGTPVLEHRTVMRHRNLFAIYWNDMLDALNLNDTTSAHCNHFIARPDHMLKFIKWSYWQARPAALQHPLALADYDYRAKTLTKDELMKVCGRPHYPFVVFIMERLNKCWFDKYVTHTKPVPKRTRLPYPTRLPQPDPAIPSTNYQHLFMMMTKPKPQPPPPPSPTIDEETNPATETPVTETPEAKNNAVGLDS